MQAKDQLIMSNHLGRVLDLLFPKRLFLLAPLSVPPDCNVEITFVTSLLVIPTEIINFPIIGLLTMVIWQLKQPYHETLTRSFAPSNILALSSSCLTSAIIASSAAPRDFM